MINQMNRRKKASLSEDQMIRYLENQLDARERAAMDRILAHCAPCRDDLEQLRRWLPYRQALRQQVPDERPSPGFSSRLQQAIHREAAALQPAARPTSARWSGPARLRRLGLAAASLVILAGLWSVYTLSRPPARSTASLPETTLAAALDQAETAGQAAPEAALEPSVTAAGEAGLQSLPGTESGPAPQAKLFMQVARTWFPVTEDFVLPVTRQSAPDIPVLAGELLATAQAVIWIEPNRLVAAWPATDSADPAGLLADRLSDLTPQVTVTIASADQIEPQLSDWLAGESPDAWAALEQPDCQYLILEFGGH